MNGNNASRPFTPAPLEADCHEIFDTAKTLLATLGCPLFDSVSRRESSGTQSEALFLKAQGADGRGLYTEEGLVVLKGSTGRRENVPSIRGTANERSRERLIESGVVRAEGDRIVFTKDHVFSSPSKAAVALLGRTANGWSEWKDSEGRTLDQLKRVVPTDRED
jgi:hypothetical protein